MTGMPWFRVYSELLNDRKIKRICKKTGQTKAMVIGVWICLLALANDSPRRGFLSIANDLPYSIEDLEDETDVPREILSQLLDEFKDMGMINGQVTIEIINWEKRQFKSDNSTERVRQHREKRSNETLPKRSSNVLDTDTESDSDTDTESPLPQPSCNIFKLYEQNFGALTPMISDKLRQAENDYPLEWIEEAFKISVSKNARNWSYAEAILKRWMIDGFKVDRRAHAESRPASEVY